MSQKPEELRWQDFGNPELTEEDTDFDLDLEEEDFMYLPSFAEAAEEFVRGKK